MSLKETFCTTAVKYQSSNSSRSPFDDSYTFPSFHLPFIMHLYTGGSSFFHCQGGGKLHETQGTRTASLMKRRKQLSQCQVSAETMRFSFRLQWPYENKEGRKEILKVIAALYWESPMCFEKWVSAFLLENSLLTNGPHFIPGQLELLFHVIHWGYVCVVYVYVCMSV